MLIITSQKRHHSDICKEIVNKYEIITPEKTSYRACIKKILCSTISKNGKLHKILEIVFQQTKN
jgi:hypothetical protein